MFGVNVLKRAQPMIGGKKSQWLVFSTKTLTFEGSKLFCTYTLQEYNFLLLMIFNRFSSSTDVVNAEKCRLEKKGRSSLIFKRGRENQF